MKYNFLIAMNALLVLLAILILSQTRNDDFPQPQFFPTSLTVDNHSKSNKDGFPAPNG